MWCVQPDAGGGGAAGSAGAPQRQAGRGGERAPGPRHRQKGPREGHQHQGMVLSMHTGLSENNFEGPRVGLHNIKVIAKYCSVLIRPEMEVPEIILVKVSRLCQLCRVSVIHFFF